MDGARVTRARVAKATAQAAQPSGAQVTGKTPTKASSHVRRRKTVASKEPRKTRAAAKAKPDPEGDYCPGTASRLTTASKSTNLIPDGVMKGAVLKARESLHLIWGARLLNISIANVFDQ